MGIYLEKTEDVGALRPVLEKLAGISEFEAYRFCDDFADIHKRYDVFKIVYSGGAAILKLYDEAPEAYECEQKTYQSFPEGAPVPQVLGFADGFMLSEFIPGDDLKEVTDETAAAAGMSVAEIMNAFPMDREYDRTEADKLIARRKERAEFLQNEPLLREAYAAYLDRLKDMPLTMENGDFLPINCIYNGERVYIIDWEFGGFLPYALDIARFMAHSGEGKEYTYRMTDRQKQIFMDTIYENLLVKPARGTFDRDVQMALLDELIIILKRYLTDLTVPREAEFELYYSRACAIAKKLLS